MTLNQTLLYFVWTEEYCQTSPNKNKTLNLWHVISILVCCIFACTTSYPIINYCETHIEKSTTWWKVSQKLLSVTIHRCAQIDFDELSYMFNQNQDESSGNHIATWADTAFNNSSRLWKLVQKSYLAASLILWNYNLDKWTLRNF